MELVKPVRKRPLGRWEGNIRMDLKEIGRPTNRRNVNAALNLRFP